MDCIEARDGLSRYVDEELGLDERWRVERHLAGCAACADELRSLRGLRERLHAVDPAAGGAGGGPSPEAFRTATLERARLLLARRAKPGARRRWLGWAAPAAALAIVAAAAGWAGLRGSAAGRTAVANPDGEPMATRGGTSGVAVAGRTDAPPSPREVCRARLAALAGDDLLGHYKLGLWCEANGLAEEALDRFRAVVALDADHAAARERLGQVRVRGTWLARTEAEARGFRLVHGEWLTAEDAERIACGLRLHEGEWRTPEQILAARGFVLHEGLWMTPAERDERLRGGPARPEDEVTVRGIAASLAPEALHVLEGVVVGEPRRHAHVAVYPLLAAGPTRSDLRTLAEAAQAGEIEVLDADSHVHLRNDGTTGIFVTAGQILEGGHQDRVNLRSLVVAPGTARQLEVMCCEHGRSSGTSRAFRGFGRLAPPSVRRLTTAADQAAVWKRIAGVLAGAQVQSSTEALRLAYEDAGFVARERGFAEALGEPAPGRGDRCIGLVAVVGERVASLDLFGGADLFAQEYPKLLGSLAAEAAPEAGVASARPSRRFVRSFVERLAFAHYRRAPIVVREPMIPTGDSRALVAPEEESHRIHADFGARERLEGEALIYRGNAVHVSVHAATQD